MQTDMRQTDRHASSDPSTLLSQHTQNTATRRQICDRQTRNRQTCNRQTRNRQTYNRQTRNSQTYNRQTHDRQTCLLAIQQLHALVSAIDTRVPSRKAVNFFSKKREETYTYTPQVSKPQECCSNPQPSATRFCCSSSVHLLSIQGSLSIRPCAHRLRELPVVMYACMCV